MEEPAHKDPLTPAEFAARMKVSPVTVRAWSSKGLVHPEVTPGGHRRYPLEEVERFERQWNATGRRGALRILVVDDDAQLRGYLKELLTFDSRTIVELAADGFEAGEKVHSFRPDVVLLDQMMPGMKGTEVCRKIKELPGHSEIRVIGMSGNLSDDSNTALVNAGAELCFTKPLNAAELLRVLGLGG